MTTSDPVIEGLRAANPVPSVTSLTPTVSDATEFLAIVKGMGVIDDEAEGDDLVVNLLGPAAKRNAPPRRRGLIGVAAVAAAILVALGVVVMTDGDSNDLATDGVSSPGVSVPGVTDSVSYQWSRVPHDEAVFGGPELRRLMLSVTAAGPGLVAVGSAPSADGADAAVWTSVDGATWSRVPHDEVVFGGEGDQAMVSVTVGGPGLVAVGSDSSNPAGEDGDGAVWTSVDGITWSRVPHDETIFGGAGNQIMMDVTAAGPGLVAVGYDGSGAPYDSADQNAAVWTSVDGITWSRIPHDETIFGGEGPLWMEGVTAGGPGVVAVGLGSGPSDAPGDSDGFDTDAAVWTSVDGITWSRIPHDETIFGDEAVPGAVELQRMKDVTAAGPGLVAVGFAPTPSQGASFSTDAAVWTSVDGITWSRIPHDEEVFGGVGDHEMFAVTTAGPGLMAVGRAGSGATQGAGVWSSVDGITWSRIPHDEAVFGGVGHQVIFGVTGGGPGLVGVGLGTLSDNDEFQSPAVWVAVPED